MPEYIGMYFAENDTLVSSEDMTNPVQFNLRTDLGDEEEVRLYLQAETGYQVQDTEIEPVGATSDMWAFAPDSAGSSGTYGDWGALLSLGLVEEGAANKVYFWAKAKTTVEEDPQQDTNVEIELTGIVEPLT